MGMRHSILSVLTVMVLGLISASGCSSPARVSHVDEKPIDHTVDLCPKRGPAAFVEAAVRCVKRFGADNLDIGAQYSTDQSSLSGFVYKAGCFGGDVYLENYPMTAKVKKNDGDSCVVSFTRVAPVGKAARKIAAHKREDAVSFELTLQSGVLTEMEKEKDHDKYGRFPAEAKVSVDLDHGRMRVVEETLNCDVVYDLIQNLGCKVLKK